MHNQAAAKQLPWALVPLGVVLAISDVLTCWLFHTPPSDPPNQSVIVAVMAFMSAEGSLVAIWIAFGSRPLPVRLALAVPGVAIVFIPVFTVRDGALAFGIGLIAVVFVSIPSLAARAAGWRVIRSTTANDIAMGQPGENPTQFSLRQMFSWTLAVAMVAGLMRLLIRPEDLGPGSGADLVTSAALCVGSGLVALAATWAALGRRHPVRRSLAVVAITAIVAFLILSMLNAVGEVVPISIGWATLNALLTACGLLLFRPVGFRLIRNGCSFASASEIRRSG